ncbi:phosphoribosylanthranilate isomerase [Brevundimonas sp.]|uniref:phosphoribosylanthranilate isomerase n=1 Tax=Brevundimonas sp. TaxID=1871086 RepID=UPI001DEDB20F|nr:phosphoribosylanthranilate isomerase [Brevundimonas sp.]MBL0948847.1 phosphoribosylanthranilate isomerase [Brevundimonas sp.]
MTLAKICGLTTPETLIVAVEAGAAFVGLVAFEKSPRHLAPEAARGLLEQTEMVETRRAKVVVVTVDPDDALLDALTRHVAPDFIQLHGHETRERAAAVRARTGAGIIKCLPVSGPDDLTSVADWAGVADHLMFDARTPADATLPGGMGLSFDWALLQGLDLPRPWFLAGGLNPANVAQAVRLSGAHMVDVSSGVERAPGVKEPALMRAFLEAVGTLPGKQSS